MARENTGILMRCGRCLQQSVVSEMKYAKDGTTLVCTNCRGLSIQEHLEKLRRKRQVQSFDITPPSSATKLRVHQLRLHLFSQESETWQMPLLCQGDDCRTGFDLECLVVG
jgi:uracil phosphoribosyltransferase